MEIKRPISPSLSGSSQTLADYILGFSSQSPDQRQYATTHISRLVRSLELTPKGNPSERVLEMGAYMQITPALKTRLGYGEVRGSYLGELGKFDVKHVVSKSGEEFTCQVDLFNAERDIYPYDSGSFAAVLCCELFEHLSEDPMFLLAEVNRILKLGGHLILSTPNINSLRSVSAVLTGYHPALYQQFIRVREGSSAEPRHAREYTPNEIRLAMESAGFSVEKLETGPYGLEEHPGLEWVTQLLQTHGLSLDLRGETIHAVARKDGEVRDRFPSWLYD